MIADMLAGLAVFGLLWSATAPTKRACPRGWWMAEGVRRSGEFKCRPALLGPENDAPQPAGELRGFVVCPKGTEPRQNGLSVWCQR